MRDDTPHAGACFDALCLTTLTRDRSPGVKKALGYDVGEGVAPVDPDLSAGDVDCVVIDVGNPRSTATTHPARTVPGVGALRDAALSFHRIEHGVADLADRHF